MRLERRPDAMPISHISVLGHLLERGPLSAGAVAQLDGLQPQSVSRVLATLETDGLIVRQANEDDRREARLSITESGRQALRDEMAPRDQWLAARLQSELSWRERFTLRSCVNLLDRLAGNTPAEPFPPPGATAPAVIGAGSSAPIFPSSNLRRTVDIYAGLGFRCDFDDGDDVDEGDNYAMLFCNGVDVHYAYSDFHDPLVRAGMGFFEVDDVDALHARLLALGVPTSDDFFAGIGYTEPEDLLRHWQAGNSVARVTEVEDKRWFVREFAFADPDNNLLRFGKLLPIP
jgi:DNA-binding MarR family transcriptional regulator